MKNDSTSNEASSANDRGPTPTHAFNPAAAAVVEVTQQQWRTPLLQVHSSAESTRGTANAPPTLRDRFLNVLDSDDYALLKRIALDLVESRNPLPGMTCEKLGLPPRSTYGAAARQVLAL